MNPLYESMRKHPDTGPVLELLELVDPVDEFSKALCLVRDCFSPSDTLRLLSHRQLKNLLWHRTRLMATFETAVNEAAKEAGANPKTWAEAVQVLSPGQFYKLRDAYDAQVRVLMGRSLR